MNNIWELVHHGEGEYKESWETPPVLVCKACRKDKPHHRKDCPIDSLLTDKAALADEIEGLETQLTEAANIIEASNSLLTHIMEQLPQEDRLTPTLPILTENDAVPPGKIDITGWGDETKQFINEPDPEAPVFTSEAVSRFLKGFKRGYKKGQNLRERFSRIFPGLGDLL